MICYGREHLGHACSDCGAAAICDACFATTGNAPFKDEACHKRATCDNWVMVTAMQGMSSEQGHPLCIDTDDPCNEFWFPNDWNSFFERKRTPIAQSQFGGHVSLLELGPVVCMIADGLSTPLTIVKGLLLSYGEETVRKMEDIVIHMVGASIEEFRSTKRYMELSHLLPSLKRLKLVFIGPSIPVEEKGGNVGEGVKKYRCEATFDLVKATYEEYMKTDAASTPTMVFAQHSGVEEAAGAANFASQWDPAIALMCQMDVPCMFTGYTLEESELGVLRLKDTANVTQEATTNTFRGLGPLPDAALDGFYYLNAGYFIFQGCKQ